MRAVCKYMCSACCTVCCVQKYCDAMAVCLQTRYVVTEGVSQHWEVLSLRGFPPPLCGDIFFYFFCSSSSSVTAVFGEGV